MPLPHPVIVVPGITAAYLVDHYTLPPDTIWSVLTKEYERAALHPDNPVYEALEPAQVRAGQLFEVAYKELIEELRFNLREAEDEPVPVYPFGYDWRQPLETAARDLGLFIDEVIARTKLIRHYDKAGYGKEDDFPAQVNLVGHSMGGLVIATYLDQARRNAKVARVVSLATPFRGSFESIVKITTGVGGLGSAAPSSREREAARTTPALYYLIPDLPDAVDVGDPAIPKDLFNPAAWQPSIIDTIAEYIRLHGVAPPGSLAARRALAQKLFEGMLAAAQTGRGKTNAFRLPMAGMTDDRWLCIVGVNSETRVKVAIKKAGRAVEFDFQDGHLQNTWPDHDPPQGLETGDGTVPLAGALPAFLPRERIVAVKPDDFDRMEIADKILASTAGFHGILPNMNMLHRLIVRFFKNGTDARKNTWGRPVPGVSADDWNPPLRGGLSLED